MNSKTAKGLKNTLKITLLLLTIIMLNHSCVKDEALGKKDNPQPNISDITKLRYELPVVFHIFYNDENDEKINIPSERIYEILNECNDVYAGRTSPTSIDMNLRFVLAEKDDRGNTLKEKGINRIKVADPEFEHSKFMSNISMVKHLYDVNKYINIMLYPFKIPVGENKGITLGVSHIPYTVKPDHLDGLDKLSYFPTHAQLKYPHCLSINSRYIDEIRSIEGRIYNSRDVVNTLSHELGHYLGLYHAFNEEKEGNSLKLTHKCVDSDYCRDTPAYNRIEYNNYSNGYIEDILKIRKFKYEDLLEILKRKDCMNHSTTTPNNVMDYEFSFQNRFTPQQKERVRFVLNNSPFVPGPKKSKTRTRTTEGVIDFPVRLSNCPTISED